MSDHQPTQAPGPYEAPTVEELPERDGTVETAAAAAFTGGDV